MIEGYKKELETQPEEPYNVKGISENAEEEEILNRPTEKEVYMKSNEEEESEDEEQPLEKKYNEEIIEVMRAGKPRKTKVLNVPIMWDGKEKIVQIKKLNFGLRAEYSEKFVNIQMQGEFQNMQLLLAEMQIQGLIFTLHKAPFEISDDYIRNELDGDIGERLYAIGDEYNKLNDKTKKK